MAELVIDPNHIHLPTNAMEDIGELIRNRQHILTVARQLAVATPTASVPVFLSKFLPETGIEIPSARRVCRALWNLKNFQKKMEMDTPQLIVYLTKSIESHFDQTWKTANLAAWNETIAILKSVLDEITDDHPLMISAKANSLAYTHQNLFTNAKLITDMRPVFDTSGEKIVEIVITHLLVLHYVDGSREQKMMTLALDQQDVAILRKQCERAERKSQVVASILSAKDLNPTLLPGDES